MDKEHKDDRQITDREWFEKNAERIQQITGARIALDYQGREGGIVEVMAMLKKERMNKGK